MMSPRRQDDNGTDGFKNEYVIAVGNAQFQRQAFDILAMQYERVLAIARATVG